jgi:ribonucleoside-diphosphate reductase alpha chain
LYVTEIFHLSPQVKEELVAKRVPWGFGPFSETIYYARYSRSTDGIQETWADTVIRNIEGMFSLLKTAAKNAGRRWADKDWHRTAHTAAVMMFDLKWTPPGRGLWVQGTEFVYEEGSDALNNCAFVKVTQLSRDAEWLMDMLMKGVGVGFSTYHLTQAFTRPSSASRRTYRVPDSREGWAESVRLLIESYESPASDAVDFDYTGIREAGVPIRRYGGTSGGYKPLELLHERLRAFLDTSCSGEVPMSRLVTDVMNCIGACVIAGNVRRSAEIALGKPGDETFMELKDWKKNPERSPWMHLSNNSIVLDGVADLGVIDNVVQRIVDNGEPGIINMPTIQSNARMGVYKIDPAEGINPCGEVPLESYETCNLSIIYPTRCTYTELTAATFCATLYSMAVSLLPSNSELTQEVVERNHRIGVGMSGLADWRDSVGRGRQCQELDRCYGIVQHTARHLSKFFGINMPIRTTTIKPDGTASLLAGVSPGMHWPWAPYVLRRVRQAANSNAADMMMQAGVPWEEDITDSNTLVFEMPVAYNGGNTRSQSEVSLEEQVQALVDYQTHWADNSVSATLTFKQREIEAMPELISEYLPRIKAASFLPDGSEGETYAQAPNTAITQEEYERRMASIRDMSWQGKAVGDGQMDKFCDTESCAI